MIETIHRHIQIASIDKDMNNVYYKYYVNLLNEIKKDCKVGYDSTNYCIFVNESPLVSIYDNCVIINTEHLLFKKDDIYNYIILYIIKKHFNKFDFHIIDLYNRYLYNDTKNGFIKYPISKKIYL